MSEEKNLLQKFSAFMDQNIRGVQYTIYSIAGLGLIIALRSVRPFAKFSSPSDIPKHFIKKKVPLIGKVIKVETSLVPGSNPLLIVDHRPLIDLPRKKKTEGLKLEISSINTTSNGFVWLQSLLSNENITFIPLRTSPDKVYSIIYNKKQNVGQQLVKIGFAMATPIDIKLEKDHFYLKYYKSLLNAEQNAEMKGLGIWSGNKVPLLRFWFYKIKNLFPFWL